VERVSLRDRARYAFDNVMARGTGALIAGLFAVSAVLIVLFAAILIATGVAGDQGLDFPAVLWRNLMRTLDPGTMGGDEGTAPFLGAMLLVTLVGIFVLSTLIGIINNGIQGRLEELRKGRSRVIESGHTVILGWSQQIHTVVAELIEANANQRRRVIVIMAERDPAAMEEEIRSRLAPGGSRTSRLVFRSGSPLDVSDLAIASVGTSRSIVILAPDSDDPDPDVIKTILAIVNHPSRRPEPYHIVAAIRDRANLAVARMVGRDEVELIPAEDVIARISAQTCRQSGLSVVYQELLDFGGDEMYLAPAEETGGTTWTDALTAFSDASPIGILSVGGKPRLNPPPDTRLEPGDRLIVIAADDDRITRRTGPAPAIDESLLSRARPRKPVAEHTLVLGWNHRAPTFLRELDHYSPPGSSVTVVARASEVAAEVQRLAPDLAQRATARVADSSDRSVLDTLAVERYDHIVVLCDSDELDPARADARTLITLLHLRDIASRQTRDFSIVSEMADLRDRALAEVARADDFIVSNQLISLMITQVSETKHLGAVFADLLDPEGSEIYLKPAGEYVVLDRPVPYYAVVEAARRRGQTAIGYRVAADAKRAEASYGIRVNPAKERSVTFKAEDRVIVLAES
jgi:voltage-gated potassium channel Kch